MVEGNQPYDEQAAGTTGAPDRRSRRRLLAGAAGVLGLAAAEVAGQAAPAQANNGNPVLQGTDNTFPTRRTAVFTPSNAEVGILADPNSSGKGSLGVYGIGGDAGCSAKAPPAPPASACRGSAPRCGQRGRWPRRGGWRLKARWPMVTAALE